MHTRRISTFLLGAWMAGSLLLSYVTFETIRVPGLVLTIPAEPVAKLAGQIGSDQMSALLRHAAAEQARYYARMWLEAQVLLGLALLVFLTLATDRRIFPLALGAMMLLLVLFQFRVLPELAYRGRQADFPPGSLSPGTMARFWAMEEVFFGVEGSKLLCGAVLAGYLFVFHASRRRVPAAPEFPLKNVANL